MTRRCMAKNCSNVLPPNRRKFCSLACSKRENQRKYAQAHPERVRAAIRRWESEHRDERRAYQRVKQRNWRAANLDRERTRARKYARKWRAEHHERFIATQRARRSTKRDVLIEQRRARDGSIPRADYLKLASRQNRVHVKKLEDIVQRISKGRTATKATIFAEAHKLRQQNVQWSTIARRLVLDEYRVNPRAAIKRLQEGERYYRQTLT